MPGLSLARSDAACTAVQASNVDHPDGSSRGVDGLGHRVIRPVRGSPRFSHQAWAAANWSYYRSEEHTSELQSHLNLVSRLLLEKKKSLNDQLAEREHGMKWLEESIK